MRYRQTLIPTLKEDPSDAEVVSHKLMVRAGMIRQVARGIYDILPLGLRVVQKVERIVREEMNRAGAQEILMPAICPAELWQESGRWEKYGRELLRLKDRYDRDFCFGPTHEELVTDIVRREVRSYRDLPMNLYQIQTKFRDEVRPRFGLMRGREFIMKDAYSFHVDTADCEREYQNMADAYHRIFRRCGLTARQVESDTGAIGGSRAHEFQVLAASGEDAIVSCDTCQYAANVEKAEGRVAPLAATAPAALEEVHTPAKRTVDEVATFLGRPRERFIKTLVYLASNGAAVAALVRGDQELSEVKLKNALGVDAVTLADEQTVEKVTGAPLGFAGPIGLQIRILADASLRGLTGGVAGANHADHHIVGLEQERDLPKLEFTDLRVAGAGDGCPRCDEGVLESHRGIEVGNIFYLGTKYSVPMNANFLDADGQSRPMQMGCYGIGITRTAAAAIEQNNDANGILWPVSIAPAHVYLMPVNSKDARLLETAERLYAELKGTGVEVLLDDRDERPGVKFKDADLLGLPLRITIGAKSLDRGNVEWKPRRDAEASEVPVGDVVAKAAGFVRDNTPAGD